MNNNNKESRNVCFSRLLVSSFVSVRIQSIFNKKLCFTKNKIFFCFLAVLYSSDKNLKPFICCRFFFLFRVLVVEHHFNGLCVNFFLYLAFSRFWKRHALCTHFKLPKNVHQLDKNERTATKSNSKQSANPSKKEKLFSDFRCHHHSKRIENDTRYINFVCSGCVYFKNKHDGWVCCSLQ